MKGVMKLTLRLYPDRDGDLIAWVRGQTRGDRSRMVKEALRAGIQRGSGPTPAGVLDLAEIRLVVEAAVETSLARLGGQALAVFAVAPDDDRETEAMLDSLAASLVIGGEK